VAVDEATFLAELTRAFDARLGEVQEVSARALFPLRRQLATDYVAGRVALLGDAAHAVHPLAGQGVNLGLRDVAALRGQWQQAVGRGVDFAAPHRLARWERARRSENAVAAYGFEAINRAFSNDALLPTVLRGPMLGLAGRLPPLSRLLWKRAAGG
jgi:2-octaprenyl-3-methyl-6-methoxy-1,4-benzoquinol hydroxylase